MRESGLRKDNLLEQNRFFPLVRELFDFAEELGLNEGNWSDYANEDGDRRQTRAAPLPSKFLPLLSKYPDTYYVVGYYRREGPYYQMHTRGRVVRLSTVQNRRETESKIREMHFREVDPLEGVKIETRVIESINNKSYNAADRKDEETLEVSHGFAEHTSETDVNGPEQIRSLRYNRLDEGLCTYRDAKQPVRWVRDLIIERGPPQKLHTTYRDIYIIGNRREIKSNAQIQTHITGSLDHPTSIAVELGIGELERGRIIFEDRARKITISVQHPVGTMEKRPIAFFSRDPAYACLFQDPPDVDTFIHNLALRIARLRDEWDQPQPIFLHDNELEGSDHLKLE